MHLGSKQFSVLLMVILFTSTLPVLSLPHASADLSDPNSLKTHATILINGDSQFTAANGVVGGNGTKENPYIIENWSIDATNNHGIYLKNTDAYYSIRNCYIYNGTNQNFNNHGIYLKNSNNGTIIENRIFRVNTCIYLDGNCNKNVIAHNTLKNCSYGFQIFTSNNNILNNNSILTYNMGMSIFKSKINITKNTIIRDKTISSNNEYGLSIRYCENIFINDNYIYGFHRGGMYQAGILFDKSKYNIVNNNSIIRNKIGIYFWDDSYYNTLSDNTMIDNIEYGIYLREYGSIACNNSIDQTNTINGDPVLYFYEVHGTEKNPIIIEDLTLTGNNTLSVGKIFLFYCKNFIIRNCNIENSNVEGIKIQESNNIEIYSNRISNNSEGIFFVGSEKVNITGNEFINNSVGIYPFYSKNILISNNTISEYFFGIENYYSDNTIISKNNISMGEYGIYSENSDNDVIINNKIFNNNISGLLFYSLSQPSIINNTILGSGDYDIYLHPNLNLTVFDTVFDTIKFIEHYSNYDSWLMVKNHVRIRTLDTNGESPLSGADLIVQDNDNTIYSSSGYGGTEPKTDNNGLSPEILIIDRIYWSSYDNPIENLTKIQVKHGTWEDIRYNVDMYRPHTEIFHKSVVTPKIPDFVLNDEDIFFSDDEPIDNENIVLYAKIHNQGNSGGSAEVNFYSGHPSGGKLLGNDSITISYGEIGVAALEWRAIEGSNSIWVVVDEDDIVTEFNEKNNIGFSNLVVGHNWGTIEWLNPYPGGSLITCTAWHPNGSYALVVNGYGKLYKYDGKNFYSIPTYSSYYARHISWKPDGSYALLAGNGGPILKFDGNKLIVLSNKWQYDYCSSITWSPNGSYALITIGNQVIKYDGSAFSVYGQCGNRYMRDFYDLKWYPDGKDILIASSCGNNIGGELYRFDGTTFNLIFNQSKYHFSKIAWNQKENYAIIIGSDRDKAAVWKYNIEGRTCDLIYKHDYNDYFSDVVWDPNYNYAYIVGSRGWFFKFDGTDFIDMRNNTNSYADLFGIALKPNSDNLMLVGRENTILEFNGTAFNKISRDITENKLSGFYSLSWKTDGSSAFMVSWNKGLVQYQNNKLTNIKIENFSEGLFDIAWKPDNSNALIVGCDDDPRVGQIFKFDGFNITNIENPYGIEEFWSVAWHPTGDHALIVGSSGSIFKYNGNKLTLISNSTDILFKDVAWKPDGSYAIITGYYESNNTGVVVKYDGAIVDNIAEIEGNWLNAISWKPDGSYCLIAGARKVYKYNEKDLIDLECPVMYNCIFGVSWDYAGDLALITGGGAGFNTLIFDGHDFFKIPFDAEGLMWAVSWCPNENFALIVGWNGAILKFTPEPSRLNTPPIAKLAVNKTEVHIGELIEFNAAGSTDDLGIIEYYFDFGDGNNSGCINEPIITYCYSTPGRYSASLMVRDTNSAINLNHASVDITIIKPYERPVIFIGSPKNNETVNGTVNITGWASSKFDIIQLVEIKIQYTNDTDDETWYHANGTTNWSYIWDTSMYQDGVHFIFARAYDGILYSNFASVRVDVCPCLPNNNITGDKDNDNIPDKWELEYGLDPNNTADALEDWDGDGYTNLEEYLAGTNPLDRTSYPGINLSPVAHAGENKTVKVGELITFNGFLSYDPDGSIINYTWEFGDGEFGYGVTTTYIYQNIGTYFVKLTVMDDRGNTSSDIIQIIVKTEPKQEEKDEASGQAYLWAIIIAGIIVLIIVILLISTVLKDRIGRMRKKELAPEVFEGRMEFGKELAGEVESVVELDVEE